MLLLHWYKCVCSIFRCAFSKLFLFFRHCHSDHYGIIMVIMIIIDRYCAYTHYRISLTTIESFNVSVAILATQMSTNIFSMQISSSVANCPKCWSFVPCHFFCYFFFNFFYSFLIWFSTAFLSNAFGTCIFVRRRCCRLYNHGIMRITVLFRYETLYCLFFCLFSFLSFISLRI